MKNRRTLGRVDYNRKSPGINAFSFVAIYILIPFFLIIENPKTHGTHTHASAEKNDYPGVIYFVSVHRKAQSTRRYVICISARPIHNASSSRNSRNIILHLSGRPCTLSLSSSSRPYIPRPSDITIKRRRHVYTHTLFSSLPYTHTQTISRDGIPRL